jgi:hypothetical protein
MKLTFAQFLTQLANASGVVSIANGTAYFDNGDTFEVTAGIVSLQTLLMSAALDLKDADSQLQQFTSMQQDDKPFFQDTREKLNALREELADVGVEPAEEVAPVPGVRMTVSTDGGSTYRPAPNGVRICYDNMLVPGEDEPGQLHITATTEGLITDVWVSHDDHLDHNIGTSSKPLDDIIEDLVNDND